MRTHVRDAACILAAAAAIRLALFSGFVLGDDPAYGDLAHQLLSGRYPPVEGLNVFATRPILLGSIAASVGMVGWTEFAFVLPVLAASLAGIAATYALGVLVSDRSSGIIAALTLAVFPLDVVYSTTMANDIIASAFAGVGAALAAGGVRLASDDVRRAAWLALAGGGLVGLATAVKLSSFASGLPLILIVAILVVRRAAPLPVTLAIGLGWIAAQAAIALFFRIQAGGWLDHFRVEWAFNQTNMLAPYAGSVSQALLAYPKWVLGVAFVGPINHRFFPFGFFFPIGLIALAAALIWNGRRLWFLAIWFITLFLVLEFWPLQLTPHYVPIHRLPRFLHPLGLPLAVLVGAIFSQAWRRGLAIRVAAVAIWVTYAVTSVSGSLAGSTRHRDAMLDQRFVAPIALTYPGPVIADAELLNYLRYRSGYQDRDRWLTLSPKKPRVPDRALVITGGGRRVDLDPMYVVEHGLPEIPTTWVKLADMPGMRGPGRFRRGSVHVAVGGLPNLKSTPEAFLRDACPPSINWQLRDTIDVGDPASEQRHGYTVEAASWSGVRTLQDHSGSSWTENGRAFRGSQAFDAERLSRGADICVAVLVDARVRDQKSRWFLGMEDLGTVVTSGRGPNGAWLVKIVLVPARFINEARVRLREEFVSSAVDVNAFLIEIYQKEAIGR